MSQTRLVSEINDLIQELEVFQKGGEATKKNAFVPNSPIQIQFAQSGSVEPKSSTTSSAGAEMQGKKRHFEANVFECTQSSKKSKVVLNSSFDLQQEAKHEFANMLVEGCKAVYGEDKCSNMNAELLMKGIRPPKHGQCHLAINVFSMARMLAVKPFVPKEVGDAMVEFFEASHAKRHIFANVESVYQNPANTRGPSFINITLNNQFLAQIIGKINDEQNSFVGPRHRLESERDTVMVEYSQPNTHKAFHVGHMRNCAIGDCIWRLYEHIGHKVIPVNYFGDEGAHIAKCLWLINKMIKEEGLDLKSIPESERGNFLGDAYTRASKMVSLATYTHFPEKTLVVAEIKSKKPHPKDPNWGVVTVDFGAEKCATVVCGGSCYEVGDMIVYCPVGGSYKKKTAVPKDMRGVTSEGVIMGALELGVSLDHLKPYHAKYNFVSRKQPVVAKPKEQEEESVEASGGKKKKKKKKKKKDAPPPDKRILILPKNAPIGQSFADFGRIPDLPAHLASKLELDVEHKEYIEVMQMCTLYQQYVHPDLVVPADVELEQLLEKRVNEYRDVLIRLEENDAYYKPLWDETKEWSFDCFKEIYDWLGCRFDHDFTESECSELSQTIVDEYYDKGVFIKSDGCIGCQLDKKRGFCMLRKSNGSGLYATKDLALARIKFNQYNVDRSFYVVDDGQSLHFEQVFATLGKMGFKQAERCVHIPYAKVNGPGGAKMSSRDGNVILFKDLREKLSQALDEEFIAKLDGSDEEKEEIRKLCSVGVIRYGMLNHDVGKPISFDIKEWSAVSGGNTGPYLMMQYARVKSIQRKVPAPMGVKPDYSKIADEHTQQILLKLSDFQNQVTRAAGEGKGEIPNPSPLCNYLYELAKEFSRWFSNADKIKGNPDKEHQMAQLLFCQAVAAVLDRGLGLLGIKTLERM